MPLLITFLIKRKKQNAYLYYEADKEGFYQNPILYIAFGLSLLKCSSCLLFWGSIK